MAAPIDPIALAQDLIRRPSVTPTDAGALDIVQEALEGLGFNCRRMRFGEIENLYARYGTASPNLCFAGPKRDHVFMAATQSIYMLRVNIQGASPG